MQHVIKHRCADHKIDRLTETLIVGTFNPDVKNNQADFFYGRSRNHLWTIFEHIFDRPKNELKKKSRAEKIKFIHEKHIDFIDLISEIGEEPPNYTDVYLDKLENKKWRDVIQEIEKLPF